MTRYGDLAGIRAASADPAAGFAPGLRAKLTAAAEYLDAAPEVVRVVRDVPLPEFDSTMPRTPADPDRFDALARQWGLVNPSQRLVDALG